MSLDLLPLATYAAAHLAGLEVDLEPSRLGHLGRFGEWCLFVPGPNGMRLAKTPNEWFSRLAEAGFRRAWYGFEEGRDRGWGILISTDSERYFWSLSESTVTEGSQSWKRAWCKPERSLANTLPPVYNLTDLATDLRISIEALREFNDATVRSEEFGDRFTRALALLDSEGEPDHRFAFIFPPQGFPPEAKRLAETALEANVLGGMGSWNDWHSKDPAIQAEFLKITQSFARQIGPCLTAATLAIRPQALRAKP